MVNNDGWVIPLFMRLFGAPEEAPAWLSGVTPDVCCPFAARQGSSAHAWFWRVEARLRDVAHYLFNFVKRGASKGPVLREEAARLLRARMWGVDAGERHRDALASGDLILIYLGAPQREFIGSAELASAVRDWTPSEAHVYPREARSGVVFVQVEEWDPPVPMSAVLSQSDSAEARADFEAGVVLISAHEYDTALAVAVGRG